jgi:NAD+ kinase
MNIDSMLIGVIGNTDKPETANGVRALCAILGRRGIPFLIDEALAIPFPEIGVLGELVPAETIRDRCEVVIAFGGDGTMLSTSRLLAGSGVPLLGVNLGKLGFLAEFSIDSLEETVDDLMRGVYRVVQRTLLRATFPDNPELEPIIGLNDIVIDKRDGALMLRLQAHINGDYLGTYNADGLILATPTGSTAYALAVGGPVVAPSARVMVIAPIAPHMLTARPVVVAEDAVIDVVASSHRREETVRVYADGQVHRSVPMNARISITRHEHMACLVKRTTTTYFDVLRAKLLWGIEPVLNIQRIESDD